MNIDICHCMNGSLDYLVREITTPFLKETPRMIKLICSTVIAAFGFCAAAFGTPPPPASTAAPLLYAKATVAVPPDFASRVEISPQALSHTGDRITRLRRQDGVNIRIPGPVKEAFALFMKDVQPGDRISYFHDKSGLLQVPDALLGFQYGNKTSAGYEGGLKGRLQGLPSGEGPQPSSIHTTDLAPPTSLKRTVMGLCLIREGKVIAAVAIRVGYTERK